MAEEFLTLMADLDDGSQQTLSVCFLANQKDRYGLPKK